MERDFRAEFTRYFTIQAFNEPSPILRGLIEDVLAALEERREACVSYSIALSSYTAEICYYRDRVKELHDILLNLTKNKTNALKGGTDEKSDNADNLDDPELAFCSVCFNVRPYFRLREGDGGGPGQQCSDGGGS